MDTNRSQRWRERRALWATDLTVIDPKAYTVEVIEHAIARAFIAEHHYLPTYPAAQLAVALFGRKARLEGVAVFAVPTTNAVISWHTGFDDASRGCVLARLILTDAVPQNGESFFVARAFRHLRRERPSIEAVMSYSDPGAGHIGRVYCALSAAHRAVTAPRTVLRVGGVTISGRTLSKIRLGEQGHAGANPYDHARSSVRRFGGRCEDYQPIHDWFDSSKAALCHFLHRALHHHREGVAEAIERFGPTLALADGNTASTEDVAIQHVEEDCRCLPSAADWVAGFAAPDWWPAVAPEAEALAASSARRFGGVAATYLPLHSWLFATSNWSAGPAHFLFRHHAFGLFQAEQRFGPALVGPGSAVPTRVVGERHIHTVLGRVPPASDLLRRLRGAHWMARAVPAREAGLS